MLRQLPKICLLLVLALFSGLASAAEKRPSLVLTANGVADMRRVSKPAPLYEAALKEAETRVQRSIQEGVVVPQPIDPGGGYTHERHKENYKVIHDAGILFQLTNKKEYLDHARAMLEAYASIYKDLPLHPARKNQSPGRLFWQGLNESVWLVYTIQGYDAIADALSAQERENIETNLLRPVADFLSLGSPKTFRRIHNHGTWAAAGVGMTGYALRDPSLVDRAILGMDGDGSSGFLAQLDQLFSPDGYYTEGPYYQRYALMPFVLFAQAIENNDPERKIFEHRDGILMKAIDATIQQSYAGKFFPINDAIKEKGLDTQELVYGVAAAYERSGRNDLLSVAQYQGKTVLTGAGLAVAEAVESGDVQPFKFRSMALSDGPDGDQGALSILRMGEGELAQTIVAKNTSQGLGHGHFDKLSLIFYDAGQEILTDYGAARFLNVPTKEGGRYLPENLSWAKQTVAHNTLVVGEATQFGSDWRKAQKFWPVQKYFEESERLNVVSAELKDAYDATTIQRTVVQLKSDALAAPIMVDIVRASSDERTTFDLPFHFAGQLVDFNGELISKVSERKPLGRSNGYQHLWLEASGQMEEGEGRLTFLNNNRFYTLRSLVPQNSKAYFVRTGANDPNFNLRSDQAVLFRAPKGKEALYVSVLEPHGIYNPSAEFTAGSESQFVSIDYVEKDGLNLVSLITTAGKSIRVAISNNPEKEEEHTLTYKGEEFSWAGFIKVFEE